MTTTTPHDRRRVRVGTIVWGAILVAVAVFAFLAAQFGIGPSGPAALLWTIVGFGALLVVAAIVTAVVRAIASTTRDARPSTSSGTEASSGTETAEATEEHQPID
jgi:heme/copper-type cytochrome/quinol oxidase subunit 3